MTTSAAPTNGHPPKMIETITYTGVFLTPNSKELLSQKLPPRFKTLYGDHITLVYKPDPGKLSDYPMGRPVKIFVTKEVYSHLAQAAVVQLECEGFEDKDFNSLEALHITISTAKSTPPSHSKAMITGKDLPVGENPEQQEKVSTVELDKPLELEGVLGVMMGQWAEGFLDGGTLNYFSENTRAKIEAFTAAGEPKSILKFEPGELTGYERKLIHEYAEKHGILSQSEGPKHNRQLSLLYPAKSEEDEEEWTKVQPKKKQKTGMTSKRLITNENEWKAFREKQQADLEELPEAEVKLSEEEVSKIWMAYAGDL